MKLNDKVVEQRPGVLPFSGLARQGDGPIDELVADPSPSPTQFLQSRLGADEEPAFLGQHNDSQRTQHGYAVARGQRAGAPVVENDGEARIVQGPGDDLCFSFSTTPVGQEWVNWRRGPRISQMPSSGCCQLCSSHFIRRR